MEDIEGQTEDIVREFSERLPHFPDGRIDYHASSQAPVLTCFVEHQDKILLLKRSYQVGTYQGKWNAVSGYLDEIIPLRDKILEELREELGIEESQIAHIRTAPPYRFTDEDTGKTWIIFSALASLKERPDIILDWEHTEYRWIEAEEIRDYPLVPDLEESLRLVYP